MRIRLYLSVEIVFYTIIQIIGLLQLSYLDPDEFFQSLNVVNHPFKDQTWEWHTGLRSGLHPLMFSITRIIANPFDQLLAARAIQVAVNVVSRVMFSAFLRRHGLDARLHTIMHALNLLTAVYTPRTYSNALEAALVLGCVSIWPFGPTPIIRMFAAFFIAGVTCWLRPTSGAFFAALFALTALPRPRCRPVLRAVVGLAAVPIVVVVCAGVDRLFYGRIVLPPLEFLRFNLLGGFAAFYGTSPACFYPVVLVLVAWPLAPLLIRPGPVAWRLVAASVAGIVALNLSPHKEIRFLVPFAPLLLLLFTPRAGRGRVGWVGRAAVGLFVVYSVVLLLVYGFFQQIAPIRCIPIIKDLIDQGKVGSALLPCHSIPTFAFPHGTLCTLRCDPPTVASVREDAILDHPDIAQMFIDDALPVPTMTADFIIVRASRWSQIRPDGWVIMKRWGETRVLPAAEGADDLLLVMPR